MLEYIDDYLLGKKSAHERGEWLNNNCYASNAAEDELAQLASLVGSKSTLKTSDTFEEVTMVDDAPALEFDLEEELARAFQTNEISPASAAVPEQQDLGSIQDEMVAEMQAANVMQHNVASAQVAEPPKPQFEEVGVDASDLSNAPSNTQSPVASAEDQSVLDFNEMIASELDKALAEEVQADAQFQQQQKNAFPADDIESELSKLMGFTAANPADAQVVSSDKVTEIDAAAKPAASPAPENPSPPAPKEPVEPWRDAQVVEKPPVPEAASIDPLITSPTPYTPVQMSDFEPEHTAPPEPKPASVEEPEGTSLPNAEAGNGHIDMVLGGAAALAAAAKSPAGGTSPSDQLQPSQIELAAEPQSNQAAAAAMSNSAAELRLRLDELEYENNREKRRSGRRAAMAIVAIALLGGTAALAWNFVGSESGDTPTLMASTEPVKVKPKDAGGKVVPNQDQAVFKAKEVKSQDTSKQARLTDKKEQPIAVAVAPSAPKNNARVASNQVESSSPLAIKPRSVRTVVVRPDGTIVSSNTPANSPVVVAPSTVASPALNPQDQVAKETSKPKTGDAAQPVETASIAKPNKVKTTRVTTAALRTTDAAEPASETAVNKVVAKPKPKPVAAAKPKPEQVAAVTPQPAAAAPEQDALPRVSSPYAVQISSQRSVGAAKQSYKDLSQRYDSIIGGRGVDMRQVEVKGKTYFRVRIPADSSGTATRMCNSIKEQGGDCFVTR